MKIIRLYYLLILIMFSNLICFAGFEMPFNQYYARIKNKKINVRARPSTSSEIMYQLDKGENILIIGESGDWVQFRPKDGFFAWIHKEMIEDGIVTKNNVNIRVGPSLSNSILGKLKEGDPVMEVKTEGDWIQIEIPRNMGFWIAKFLIKFLCPADSFQEYILNEKEAKKYFKEAEQFRKKELTKRYLDVNHDRIIKMYQEIVDKYSDTTEALKAHERILDTREKKAMTNQKKVTMRELRRVLRLFEEADNLRKSLMLSSEFTEEEYNNVFIKYKYIVDNYANSKEGRKSLEHLEELKLLKKAKQNEWQRVGGGVFEGKVKNYTGLVYPRATHVLVTGGFKKKVVCAIYSPNIDFRAYKKKRVSVTGTIVEKRSSEVNYPLIEVEKVSLS